MVTKPSSIPAEWLSSAKSILLLEEESILGSSHGKLLNERGYSVVLTHSGPEAYRSWDERRPDLVLLSFRQFDQGVLEFLEAIQLAIPAQRIAFLQDENLSLAPVFQDDKLVRMHEGPEDYLKKIDALLG